MINKILIKTCTNIFMIVSMALLIFSFPLYFIFIQKSAFLVIYPFIGLLYSLLFLVCVRYFPECLSYLKWILKDNFINKINSLKHYKQIKLKLILYVFGIMIFIYFLYLNISIYKIMKSNKIDIGKLQGIIIKDRELTIRDENMPR